MLLYNYVMHNL